MNLIIPGSLKFQIRKEIHNTIIRYAMYLGIYDIQFAENKQNSEYYAFKNLVLQPEPLPLPSELSDYYYTPSHLNSSIAPGINYLLDIREGLRKNALKYAREVRIEHFRKVN